MSVLVVVLLGAAIVATAFAIGVPLRASHMEEKDAEYASALEDLEAAKESRYREIREAEMDYRTGKLSEEDWKAIDRQLRAEAIELLRRLDALGAGDD